MGSHSFSETAAIAGGTWRQLSLVAILRMMTGVGATWVMAVFLNVPTMIPTVYGISLIGVIAAFAFASFYPMPDRVRFLVIESGFLLAAAVGVVLYGMPPGVAVLLGLFILLAAIYYGLKGGII